MTLLATLRITVESYLVTDQGLIVLAEIVADSSDREENKGKEDNSEIGDSIDDPSEVHTGLASEHLKLVRSQHSYKYHDASHYYEA